MIPTSTPEQNEDNENRPNTTPPDEPVKIFYSNQ